MIGDVLRELMGMKGDAALLRADPMTTLAAWLEDARSSGTYKDHNAVSLATATLDGAPSVRVVLCKGLDVASGSLTFFTNYTSRKGQELAANPRAAACFHWPHAGRQARIEGSITRVSEAESDAYFATRPLISRIGAVVSPQSSPIASRAELISAAAAVAKNAALGHPISRPPHWGGFRLLALRIELWQAETGRLHQRVRWSRDPGQPWDSAHGVERLAP